MLRLLTALWLAVIVVLGPAVWAEGPAAEPEPQVVVVPRADLEAMQAKLEQLQREVERLQQALGMAPSAAPPAEVAPLPAEPMVLGGAAAQGVPQTLLPDISVVGNIVGLASSDKSAANRNAFVAREVELGLQGYLYPQIRADAFIALSAEHDSSAELEEAYVSFLQPRDLRLLRWMPRDTALRMGRKLLDFGKVNPIHPHHWPYVNAPTAIDNFMGHGFGGDGLSLGYLLPTATFANLELGMWHFAPHQHAHDEDEDHPHLGAGFDGRVYSARLWTSRALGHLAELELGLSAATGHGYRHLGNDHDHEEGAEHEEEIRVRDRIALAGLDLTYKRWPAAHQRLLIQGEALWHRRRGSHLHEGEVHREGRTSRGYYLFGNYQWDKYWDAGLLYNWSQRPFPEGGHDSGVSAILTNRLTETTSLRLQYDYASRPGAGRVHEGWLQVLWGIGPHSHPLE